MVKKVNGIVVIGQDIEYKFWDIMLQLYTLWTYGVLCPFWLPPDQKNIIKHKRVQKLFISMLMEL